MRAYVSLAFCAVWLTPSCGTSCPKKANWIKPEHSAKECAERVAKIVCDQSLEERERTSRITAEAYANPNKKTGELVHVYAEICGCVLSSEVCFLGTIMDKEGDESVSYAVSRGVPSCAGDQSVKGLDTTKCGDIERIVYGGKH